MSIRIKVDSGKYEFVQQGTKIDVLRHGQPWIQGLDGFNAIFSLMAELDASRLVLAAARDCVTTNELNGRSDFVRGLSRALKVHSRLVTDTTPPSAWARPAIDDPGAKQP